MIPKELARKIRYIQIYTSKAVNDILAGAIASIPSCPGEASLAKMVQMQSERIVPKPAIRHRARGWPPIRALPRTLRARASWIA